MILNNLETEKSQLFFILENDYDPPTLFEESVDFGSSVYLVESGELKLLLLFGIAFVLDENLASSEFDKEERRNCDVARYIGTTFNPLFVLLKPRGSVTFSIFLFRSMPCIWWMCQLCDGSQEP